MATYIGIKGSDIPAVSSDPSNPILGQLWYNTTSNTLKGYAQAGTGAWATGGSLLTGTLNSSYIGTQTAALKSGGGSPPLQDASESYDGTSWTATNPLLSAATQSGGAGTQAAGIAFCGDPTPNRDKTESWDGLCWSEANDLNSQRDDTGGEAGTQGAALCISGGGGALLTTNVEIYDGTCWAETGNAVNTARYNAGGCGTTTASLLVGGRSPTTAKTETYNGSSWTEVTAFNTARYGFGETGGSPNTAYMIFGGNPPTSGTDITETWDGSTWTEVADLATGRQMLAQGTCGTAILGLAVGGGTPTAVTTVEEFTVPNATKTFTSS